MTWRSDVSAGAGAGSRLATMTAELADEIIARDLPALGAEERAAAVRMVVVAVSGLPDTVRPGVTVAGFALRAVQRWRSAPQGVLDLPVLREYVRLVRGLSLAAACEVSLEHDGTTP